MRFLVLVLLFEKFANWPKLSFSIVIVFVCLDDLAAYDGRTITDETFYKTVFSEFAWIRQYGLRCVVCTMVIHVFQHYSVLWLTNSASCFRGDKSCCFNRLFNPNAECCCVAFGL